MTPASLLACAQVDLGAAPTIGATHEVVPGTGLPVDLVVQAANNNLDVTLHDGRWWLAFRTAPNHFASGDVQMHVVSSADQVHWTWEGTFDRDTDLREPQLVSWRGDLYLHFAVLGDEPTDFSPQGAMWTRRTGPGTWEEPAWHALDGLIPWRIKPVGDALHLFGYTGGENVYDADGEPVVVHWLSSYDGIAWQPAHADVGSAILTGGGSETDAVTLADGTVVAVVRNEAGTDGSFGSRICRGEAASPARWECLDDPRKYDSPLLFEHDGRVWLIARRSLDNDGLYDLGLDDLDDESQYLQYQLAWWQSPKRCSLWSVDAVERSVSHVLDLPSAGDTCFPEAVPDGPDAWWVYNYSSPLDGTEPAWFEGQTGPTQIRRTRLTWQPTAE